MDVITAFLNGDLDEVIYMMIPEGLRTPQNEGMVWKLLKSLAEKRAVERTYF